MLAKELATLDELSGGRVVAGVGVGWHAGEFANVGAADRFHVRGAYLDETIRLWRHLWSGSREPFPGRFHALDDFAFEPLPVQSPLPIVVGGRDPRALHRAGALADGYHSSAVGPATYAERVPAVLRRRRRGRPPGTMAVRPRSRRVTTQPSSGYAMRGSAEDIATEVRAFAALGVTHLALSFGTTDPAELVARADAFARDVAPLI